MLHWVDPSRQSKITEALATVQPGQRSRTQKTEYYIFFIESDPIDPGLAGYSPLEEVRHAVKLNS